MGVLIINETEYPDVPVKMSMVVEDYGVRSTSKRLLGGKRIVTVDSSADVGDYTHYRRSKVQAWNAVWDGKESWIDDVFRQELKYLYDTQTPFYMQLDGEMSRCYGRAVVANVNELDDQSKPKAYFTPTYPIFPYGYVPGGSVSWGNPQDLVVAQNYWAGSYTVDQQTGLLLISPGTYKFSNSTKVYFRYTWRAYLRIVSFVWEPIDVSQTIYSANMIVEQLPFPS